MDEEIKQLKLQLERELKDNNGLRDVIMKQGKKLDKIKKIYKSDINRAELEDQIDEVFDDNES